MCLAKGCSRGDISFKAAMWWQWHPVDDYMPEGLRSGLDVTEWILVTVICWAIKLITQGAGISVKDLIFQSATGSVYYGNCKWQEPLPNMNSVCETKRTMQTKGEAAYPHNAGVQLLQHIIGCRRKQPINQIPSLSLENSTAHQVMHRLFNQHLRENKKHWQVDPVWASFVRSQFSLLWKVKSLSFVIPSKHYYLFIYLFLQTNVFWLAWVQRKLGDISMLIVSF